MLMVSVYGDVRSSIVVWRGTRTVRSCHVWDGSADPQPRLHSGERARGQSSLLFVFRARLMARLQRRLRWVSGTAQPAEPGLFRINYNCVSALEYKLIA